MSKGQPNNNELTKNKRVFDYFNIQTLHLLQCSTQTMVLYSVTLYITTDLKWHLFILLTINSLKVNIYFNASFSIFLLWKEAGFRQLGMIYNYINLTIAATNVMPALWGIMIILIFINSFDLFYKVKVALNLSMIQFLISVLWSINGTPIILWYIR